MKKILKTAFAVVLTLLLIACRTAETTPDGALKYATLFSLEEGEGCTVVRMRDAWHEGRTAATYVLVPRSAELPDTLPAGTLLRTPLRRVVAFSSVHAALLADLDRLGAVCAMTDTAYVVDGRLRSRLSEGSIADAGSSMQPDAERLVHLAPEALLVSDMPDDAPSPTAAAGIPTIVLADYMETSALGRAEWMRLFGRLFGCEARADSLFAAVETAYDSLRTAAAATTERPRLLAEMKQGEAWYVPGGRSYLGRLYADAGADYLFSDREESSSAVLSAEAVAERALTADVWLVKYARAADMTRDDMKADYPPYAAFRPWKEGRVFGCNTLRIPYYEETPFHPDRLLRDVVALLHPEILKGYRPRYFTPLH